MSPEPLIEVRDLHIHFPVKGYGVVRAVDGVHCAWPGEIVGPVGESGCGKMTIGRCITGELAATQGAVLLSGEVVGRRRESAVRRSIQMVYQDPATSRVRACPCARCSGAAARPPPRAPRSVRGSLPGAPEYAGLPPRALDGYPHQFSGGQRQRIAIARALAVEPRMLVR